MRFDGEEGLLSEDEIRDVVEDTLDSLRDAPVQTFVPLFAENTARDRLRQRADEKQGGD